jgi:hypothetical protein
VHATRFVMAQSGCHDNEASVALRAVSFAFGRIKEQNCRVLTWEAADK